MSSNRDELKKELRQAGAGTREAEQLAVVADKLQKLKPAEAGNYKPSRWLKILKPAALALSTLVVGAVIVMFAQSASPTSWLYPVQELSDAVAAKTHPQYRATVMMRRAQQVSALVSAHASRSVILATLASYNNEATSYKLSPNSNYAALDYCKNNLEQAAAAAPADVRQAIMNSLRNLNNT